MKKILSIIAITIAVVFVSCSDDKTASDAASTDTKESTMTQKNLDAYHAVEKAFETGDVSGIDSVVSPDFVDHTERGEMGRDSLKAMIVAMHKTYADMKAEKLKDLADDEYVMGMRRYTGTSNGDPGMPPKGQPYSMTSIEVVKFKDGKAIEHWAFMEMSEMMKMMAPQTGDKK